MKLSWDKFHAFFPPLTPQPLLLLYLSRAIHPTLPYYFPPFPLPHPSPLSHLFLMHTHPFLPIPVEIHYKLTTDATLHQLTQISQSATFTDNPHLSLLPPSFISLSSVSPSSACCGPDGMRVSWRWTRRLSFLTLLPSAPFAAAAGNSRGILPFLGASCLMVHNSFCPQGTVKEAYTWLAGVAEDIMRPRWRLRSLKLISFQLRRKWSENLKRLSDNQGHWIFFWLYTSEMTWQMKRQSNSNHVTLWY